MKGSLDYDTKGVFFESLKIYLPFFGIVSKVSTM